MSLLDKTFDRTLDAWTHAYMAPAWRGAHLEGWLFEDAQARRAAEARLAQAGVQARFRSAYKPLLHYFLEEVERDGLIAAEIRYPLHEHAQAKRFTLEAYPLVALLDGVRVTLQPGASDLHYDVDLRYADGREIQSRVFAPNQLGHAPDGVAELSPTGWLRVRDAAGETRVDAAQATEYQLAFRAAVDAVRNHAWAPTNPTSSAWRSASTCQASTSRCRSTRKSSAPTRRCTRTCTSLLEHFQQHSGRPPGDRGLQPADHSRRAPPRRRARVRISVEAFTPISAVTPALPGFPLAQAREPLSAAQIAGCMAALGGDTFQATSRQGRPVLGTYLRGPGPAVFISGAQHANETSGVVGALRAAQALAASGKGHFALIAAENPDGYALFARLREQHPRHMLHARATARWATTSPTASARRSSSATAATRRTPSAGPSCTSTCTAIPPMNGRAPCQVTCRAISSCGPSRKASSWCCATTPAGANARAG